MSVERHPYPKEAGHAPMLRALLALDGSTTRVCEAIAQAPVQLKLVHQEQTDAVPAVVREQLGGTRWLHRVTFLHAHGQVMMDNLSYTRLDAVPAWFLARLHEGVAPIGHLLQRLFVQRETLPVTPDVEDALWRHSGEPDPAASRCYRVITAESPLMLIFETYRRGMVCP